MSTQPPMPADFRGKGLQSYLDALSEWLHANAPNAAPGSGLRVVGSMAGRSFMADRAEIGWIKLTSRSGAAHAWSRVMATAGGGWSVDSSLSGTTSSDPAYEVNGQTPTLPYYARAWRDTETGEVRFSNGRC